MNLAENLERSSRFHARSAALSLGEQVVSYRELGRQSRSVAGFLMAKGVRAGERVALMLPNVLEFAPLYYGILRVGAIVVPMSPHLTEREVDLCLQDSGARMLFTWEPGTAAREPAGGDVEHVVVAPGGLGSLLGDPPRPERIVRRDPADTAAILYTSGTTDRPRGVELTHDSLVQNVDIMAQEIVELAPTDVVFGALPLFHSFGQTAALNAAVRAGACLALLPQFDATEALTTLQRHGVTVLPAVPTMYVGLLNHPDRAEVDTSRLRVCLSGGSALPVEVLLGFERAFDCVVLEGYGLSETSPVATCNEPGRRRVGSIGSPLRGVELRIVDEHGHPVTDGEVGEIAIRGHNVMKGYWKRPEATAAAVPDGWLRTGDIGRRDEDGFFYLVDRKNELITRAGCTVYPRDIEEVLYEHPAVLEAAVIGTPDPNTGEEIVALVTLRPGESTGGDELRAYLKSRVATGTHPRHVEIVPALPKTSTGKILKREITFEKTT
ncbi:long-chain fatty acid--CoA ligase [Prauserella halophila]|uniref:Long-chain fatty acid--CoA ligase n=1 Tax=Prauserella halophila TaxID=185641 RepID=A0ABN1WHS3_9PSEU|nr:long-chain fatty acid--CoA ligase [Prauserella halophila]MCP2238080.1 long-chain acyl-CoA synthetase [Prauserella halophila]